MAQPLENLLNNEGQSSDLSTDTASQCMPEFLAPRNPKHSSDLCLDTDPCISMCARTEPKAKKSVHLPTSKNLSKVLTYFNREKSDFTESVWQMPP